MAIENFALKACLVDHKTWKSTFLLVLVCLRGFQHDVGAFAQKYHITALLVIDCRFKMVDINWMTQSLEIVENEIQQ